MIELKIVLLLGLMATLLLGLRLTAGTASNG